MQKRIYLQTRDDFGNEAEEITWCVDQINDTDEEFYHSTIVNTYDSHIRLLVSYIQAFIRHQKYPDFAGCPDLKKAQIAWQNANDFNVWTLGAAPNNAVAGDANSLIDNQPPGA